MDSEHLDAIEVRRLRQAGSGVSVEAMKEWSRRLAEAEAEVKRLRDGIRQALHSDVSNPARHTLRSLLDGDA